MQPVVTEIPSSATTDEVRALENNELVVLNGRHRIAARCMDICRSITPFMHGKL
jgi:hypothetical protein